ncbi:MAG TPA: alpha/beta hydrolase [Xanthomonadaceae bacterium]|nr:alpha/beta hydrolase [Xanthomonadaceae bacterium]
MVTPSPASARVDIPTRDGLVLAAERFGSPTSPAVLFAHGFGQTRLSWRASAQAIAAEGFHALCLDGRGHGESGWRSDARPYQFEDFATDMIEVAANLPGKPALVGASMGGLLGLLTEGESDDGLFSALVLVDITPRWEQQGVERILDFMGAHPEGFASLDEAADAVLRYLPHRGRERDPERLRPLLAQGPDGRLRWHWDPRLLEDIPRDASAYQARLMAAAQRVEAPLLLVSGDRSDVVSEHTIEEFLALVPHARHVRIPGATHMVVGDANTAFTGAVTDFLRHTVLSSAA